MPELGSFIILDIAEAAEDGSDWIESRSWRDFVEAEKEGSSVQHLKPRFDVSDSLCGSCKNLLVAEWWTVTLLHESLADLLQSSKSCHLCVLFYRALHVRAVENGTVDKLNSFADEPHAWVWGFVKHRSHLGSKTDRSPHMYGIEVFIEKGPGTPQNRFQTIDDLHPEYPWAALEVDTLSGDIEALLLEAAAQDDLSSESETRLSLARHWFKNCLQYHHQCKVLQRNPVHLPSRVVDIGSSDGTQQPFLYETRGEVGAYLCLSHRWGGSHVITTTLGTLAERKSGIPIDQMPKTFRDAIIMTRKLGLKYIWIDSLCIIQDQLSDWESEAQAMGRIYKNATLTLTAVMSTSADTGLFFSYDGRQNRPCYLGTVHRVKAGHDVASTVPVESLQKTHTLRIFAKLHRQPPKGRHNYRFRPSGPLDRRGWVLQEEVLSPRLLAFGADGIYWECTAMDAAEYIPTGLTSEIDTIRYGATFKRILSQSAFARAIPDNPPVSYAVIIDSWDSMVENFSGRDLTQESDTLIALQGIVEVMKEVTGDVFLAGLWKRHLLQQLMWHIDLGHIEIEWDRPSAAVNVKSPKHVILPPRLTGPHKRSIKVPTWSWASVKHQVTWRFTGLTRPLMRVLEIDLKNQGPGNFEGRLRVRGIMRAAVARAGNQTKRDKLIDPDDPQIQSHWYFCDEIDWKDERVMCLGIAEHLGWTHCLAIYPTKNCSLVNPRSKSLEFRRVGFAIWDTNMWRQFLGPEDDGYSHIKGKVKRFSPPATIIEIL